MVTLPSHVFFTPKRYFWALMQELYSCAVTVTDCGCGMGILLGMADYFKLPMRGVDICHREALSNKIEFIDATTLSWSSSEWPMLCRPSHGQWIGTMIDRVRADGSCMIYIGLPRNVKRDLAGARFVKITTKPVGIDGEHFYVVPSNGFPYWPTIRDALKRVPYLE